MKITRILGVAATLLLVLGLLPSMALAGSGEVTICKYTGGADPTPSHLIHVSQKAADEGAFRDAQPSAVLGSRDEKDWALEDCPATPDPDPGEGDGDSGGNDDNDNDSGDNDDDGSGGNDDDDSGGSGDNDDDNDSGGSGDNDDDSGGSGGSGGGGSGGNDDDTGGSSDGDTEVADRVIERIFGETRIQTAVEVAQASHPDGADVVVLARSDLYPDALTGGPLARALDAPILLTPSHRLHQDTASEIDRLGASTVHLLGETGALSDAVAGEVDELDAVTSVERIGGPDRFATAGLIADELDSETSEDVDAVYITEGINADPTRGWPDAVSVSGLASHEGQPILLSAADALPDATSDALEALEVTDAVVVGGEAALSSDVFAAVEATGAATERVGGDTRYDTSALIADRSVEAGLHRSPIWLATGENWPDALVAGPAVAAQEGVLMLVHGGDATRSPATEQWLEANETLAGEDGLEEMVLRFVGGRAAIADLVLDQLR